MIDSFVRVVEALAKLSGTLALPLVILIVFYWFKDVFREFISKMSEGKFKFMGFEGSVKRITEALVSADLQKTNDGKLPAKELKQLQDSVGKSYSLAAQLADKLSQHRFSDKRVLWVDDQPDNNRFEVEAFRALGITIDFANSTDTALAALKNYQYDAVISDMARAEGPKEGFVLLAKMEDLEPPVPVVLYSSSQTADQRAAIRAAGAFGSTSTATELVRLVASAIDPTFVLRDNYARRVRQLRNSNSSNGDLF
ncbi:response regulator [soil metagenome]